jgi:N-acetylglucosaminyldiphosphoundecaprenol N-acetyl-beta-D-mannosaminyltransferase
VAIGVGGSFEIIAGLKREAPLFIRDSGLEWVYRMIQDPRRINRIPQLIEFWCHYLR